MKLLRVFLLVFFCYTPVTKALEFLYANNPAASTNAWYPASSTFNWPRWKFVIYNASSNVVFSGNGGQVNAGARYKAWQGATFEYPPNYTVIYISYSNSMPYTAYTNINVGNDQTVDFALPQIGAVSGTNCTTNTLWVVNPYVNVWVQGKWYYNGINYYSQSIEPRGRVASTYCLLSGDTHTATIVLLKTDLVPQLDGSYVVTNSFVEQSVDGSTNPPVVPAQNESPWAYSTNSWLSWSGVTNALTSQQIGDNRIVEAVETGNDILRKILGQGTGSSSNYVSVTNGNSDLINYLETNRQAMVTLSNSAGSLYSNIWANAQSVVSAAMTPFGGPSNAIGSAIGGAFSGISQPTPQAVTLNVPAVGGISVGNIVLDVTHLPADYFVIIRNLTAFLVWAGAAMYMWNGLKSSTMQLLQTPQRQGTSQALFGVNAELATALVAAAIILIIIGAFVVLAAGAVGPALDAWAATSFGGSADILGLSVAGMVCYAVPIAHIAGAIVAVVVFDLTVDILTVIAAAVINLIIA